MEAEKTHTGANIERNRQNSSISSKNTNNLADCNSTVPLGSSSKQQSFTAQKENISGNKSTMQIEENLTAQSGRITPMPTPLRKFDALSSGRELELFRIDGKPAYNNKNVALAEWISEWHSTRIGVSTWRFGCQKKFLEDWLEGERIQYLNQKMWYDLCMSSSSGSIANICWSPDGEVLLVLFEEGKIYFLDAQTGRTIFCTFHSFRPSMMRWLIQKLTRLQQKDAYNSRLPLFVFEQQLWDMAQACESNRKLLKHLLRSLCSFCIHNVTDHHLLCEKQFVDKADVQNFIYLIQSISLPQLPDDTSVYSGLQTYSDIAYLDNWIDRIRNINKEAESSLVEYPTKMEVTDSDKQDQKSIRLAFLDNVLPFLESDDRVEERHRFIKEPGFFLNLDSDNPKFSTQECNKILGESSCLQASMGKSLKLLRNLLRTGTSK
ncbi:anaphase-promoting complex subunit 4 WD40 domain-containing protein [Ditylenchus destructor]|uniref:Anaphase-promoting complex subunit 4 WD40 domain-containing protein n=1 Tax=Ditylenchus destructor TaxID=166010 RepID=A0AAD4RDZ4_9BILA|nr:anaphase-promoting complex subunit 4 WD40 domain-containing protein [Ditylenchus destructor]